jgi:chromosome segregation ATPase
VPHDAVRGFPAVSTLPEMKLALQSFERVEAFSGTALLRLSGVALVKGAAPGDDALLVVESAGQRHQYAPLPDPARSSPSGGWRLTFAVPGAVADGEGARFTLVPGVVDPFPLPPPPALRTLRGQLEQALTALEVQADEAREQIATARRHEQSASEARRRAQAEAAESMAALGELKRRATAEAAELRRHDEARADQARTEIAELKEAAGRADHLEAQVEQLESELQETGRRLQAANEVLGRERAEREAHAAAAVAVAEERAAWQSRLEDLDAGRTRIRERLDEVTAEATELRQRLEAVQESHQRELARREANAARQAADLRREMDVLKEAAAKAESQLAEVARLRRRAGEAQDLRTELAAAQARVKELEAVQAALGDAQRLTAEANAHLRDEQAAAQALERRLEELSGERGALLARLDDATAAAKEAATLREQLELVQEQLPAAPTAVPAPEAVDGTRLAGLEAAIREAEQEREDLARRLTLAEEAAAHATANLKDEEEARRAAERRAAEVTEERDRLLGRLDELAARLRRTEQTLETLRASEGSAAGS